MLSYRHKRRVHLGNVEVSRLSSIRVVWDPYIAIYCLKDGGRSDALWEGLVCTNGHALLLALVPVPFVDLALTEAKLDWYSANVVSGPVGILQELIFQYFQLVLVFALSPLNVAPSWVFVLCLLQKCCNTLVQVVELKLITEYVECNGLAVRLNEGLVTQYGTGDSTGIGGLVLSWWLLRVVLLLSGVVHWVVVVLLLGLTWCVSLADAHIKVDVHWSRLDLKKGDGVRAFFLEHLRYDCILSHRMSLYLC